MDQTSYSTTTSTFFWICCDDVQGQNADSGNVCAISLLNYMRQKINDAMCGANVSHLLKLSFTTKIQVHHALAKAQLFEYFLLCMHNIEVFFLYYF